MPRGDHHRRSQGHVVARVADGQRALVTDDAVVVLESDDELSFCEDEHSLRLTSRRRKQLAQPRRDLVGARASRVATNADSAIDQLNKGNEQNHDNPHRAKARVAAGVAAARQQCQYHQPIPLELPKADLV